MAAQDQTVGITTSLLFVGGTACVGFTGIGARVNAVTLQAALGGTCYIVGASTMSQGYLMIANQPITFAGPVNLSVNNQSGTTATIQVIKHLNPPSVF